MLLPSNGNGITATVLLVFLSSLSSAAYLDALKASLCTDVAAAAVTLTVAATVTVTVSVDADPTTTTVTNVETTTLTTAAAGAVAAPSISTAPAGCLTNSQAKTIVASFETILSATDRAVALLAAQSLIADEFVETSDSMNSLTGSLVSFLSSSMSALSTPSLPLFQFPIFDFRFSKTYTRMKEKKRNPKEIKTEQEKQLTCSMTICVYFLTSNS